MKSVQSWLLSQNKFQKDLKQDKSLLKRKASGATTIAISSGKGGVGKTSVSVKTAKMLADWGYKVLLLDCDYNLSNTLVKLGLPITNNFYSLISSEKTFEECLYRDGNFHLMGGCNGCSELLDEKIELEKLIIDIINTHEHEYDFILLDCPAGMGQDVLALSAYCDYRFVVVTPDKSSITDSYSLMKMLNQRYGVKENHLLVNKVSSKRQYQRIVKSLSDTMGSFLNTRLNILGGVKRVELCVDEFDSLLLEGANSAFHKNFTNILKRFTEEDFNSASHDFRDLTYRPSVSTRQEVLTIS